jgi:hypothetical protein
MTTETTRVRVLIPTAVGVVDVLLLTEEEAALGRSVACIGGTTQVADIDAAYHAFVARPTGVVERLFGPGCYRLDLSGPIDAGSSWQLGVLLAHVLRRAGRLAQEGEAARCAIWATGTVRSVDLAVGAVSHVEEKLALSPERLRQEAKAGRQVVVALPAPNAAEVTPAIRDALAQLGIEAIKVTGLEPLWGRLGLAPAPRATAAAAGRERVARVAGRQPGRWQQRLPWAAAAALALLLAIGGGVWARWATGNSDAAHCRDLRGHWGLAEKRTEVVADVHPAVARLRHGMSYAEARTILLDGGWQPVRHPWQTASQRCAPRERLCEEYTEFLMCSGSGLGHCLVELVYASGRKLEIATEGEGDRIGELKLSDWRLE